MLQPSPRSPSRRSPTPVLDRSRTPNVHASSGHAAQFHALGFWILALTFGAQHAEEIGATLELVQNLLCLEDQMRTRGARALRTSGNHHARARAHHPLHAEVLAAPTTLHLLFQRRGLSRQRHIDSACAASTLWWPASTFPTSSVEGYHIVDTRMCSPQQRCHHMLSFLQRQLQQAYLLHLAKNFTTCSTSSS